MSKQRIKRPNTPLPSIILQMLSILKKSSHIMKVLIKTVI